MIERSQMGKPKLKVEIVIGMTDSGEIVVTTSSGNHCTNLGMIEIGKVIISNQMKALNQEEEKLPSRIKLI